MYVDSDGDAQLCPYCENKVMSAIDNDASSIIHKMSENNCLAYTKNITL
jgi:hypothetical protein